MTRPLGSTPTAPSRDFTATGAGPPARPATVLTAFTVSAARQLPLAILDSSVEACLPTFRTEAADRAHVAYMPDTASPKSGHPPDSSRADLLHPGFDVTLLSNDTSPAIPNQGDCAPSSRSPPDASRAPFPHRSPRRSSANAACGGLQPPSARAAAKGHTFISCTAPCQEALPTNRTPFHVRGTVVVSVRHVGKPRQMQLMRHRDRLRRTVAVLGENQVRFTTTRVIPVERIGPMQKYDHIGILFH